MDVLRRSLEQLVASICEVCETEMSWSRSALIAAEQVVAHVFTCPAAAPSARPKRPRQLRGEQLGGVSDVNGTGVWTCAAL